MRCICGSALLPLTAPVPLAIKYRAGHSSNFTWSPQMGNPSAIQYEFAYQSVPRSASGHDLLKAAALMRAHAKRFQWSISLTCKEFHLALEVLLSSALWQPVTTLPT